MLKFGGKTEDGKYVIGIGLCRENCERLLAGEPIAYPLTQHGVDSDTVEAMVVIVGGVHEFAIATELRQTCARAGIVVGDIPSVEF